MTMMMTMIVFAIHRSAGLLSVIKDDFMQCRLLCTINKRQTNNMNNVACTM